MIDQYVETSTLTLQFSTAAGGIVIQTFTYSGNSVNVDQTCPKGRAPKKMESKKAAPYPWQPFLH